MQIGGINQEWIERLSIREAETHPPAEIWGSTDKRLIAYWNDRSFFTVREGHIVYASLIDAEMSKVHSNQMVAEAEVKTYLHSWGTMPVMDGDKAIGVVFESKSGRQADNGQSRNRFDGRWGSPALPRRNSTRTSTPESEWQTSPLLLDRQCRLHEGRRLPEDEPAEVDELMRELMQKGGHPFFMRSNLKSQENIVWYTRAMRPPARQTWKS